MIVFKSIIILALTQFIAFLLYYKIVFSNKLESINKGEKSESVGAIIEEAIRNEKILKITKLILVYIFLTAVALYVIIPFYWMIITSLKSADEVNFTKPTLFPKTVMWGNYKLAMTYNGANFLRYMYNTVVVGFWSTLGTLFTTIAAAFAFARLEFKGRDLLFTIFLSTMMIPGEMMVITNFITVSRTLGWKDTYQAMIVPFLVSVFYIYLLRQTFKQIPNELYYAAKVDGTGDFRYLLKIMIPIALPTLITITILKLMGAWNSYIWPNLITDSADMRLITNGLRTAFTDETGRSSAHLQMAATTVVTAPLLLIFIFLRKYIMRGVSRSGIKG